MEWRILLSKFLTTNKNKQGLPTNVNAYSLIYTDYQNNDCYNYDCLLARYIVISRYYLKMLVAMQMRRDLWEIRRFSIEYFLLHKLKLILNYLINCTRLFCMQMCSQQQKYIIKIKNPILTIKQSSR